MRAVPEGYLLYYEVKKGRYQTLPLNYFKKERERNNTKQTTKLNKKLVDRGRGKGKRRSKRWLQRMRPNLEHCIHFFVLCQGKEITACTRSPSGTKDSVESIQPGGVCRSVYKPTYATRC